MVSCTAVKRDSAQMLENWDRTELLEPRQAATVIFRQFSRPRQQDEADSVVLYAEHMVEVAQFLKRKAGEKRSGKSYTGQAAITNSKFWYEVRKKISEVKSGPDKTQCCNCWIAGGAAGQVGSPRRRSQQCR